MVTYQNTTPIPLFSTPSAACSLALSKAPLLSGEFPFTDVSRKIFRLFSGHFTAEIPFSWIRGSLCLGASP